jgi:hypothetical protein
MWEEILEGLKKVPWSHVIGGVVGAAGGASAASWYAGLTPEKKKEADKAALRIAIDLYVKARQRVMPISPGALVQLNHQIEKLFGKII